MTVVRRGDAGLTLVEVLVSLSLFALIGIAGFAIIESVLGVRERTDGRLERLGEVQRAFHLMRLDFEQAGEGPVTFDGTTVSFTRRETGQREPVEIAYGAADGTLTRRVRLPLAPPVTQHLLSGIGAARWRFYRAGGGWLSDWPPPGTTPGLLPDAVEIVLELDGETVWPGGSLRRVVRVPRAAMPRETAL